MGKKWITFDLDGTLMQNPFAKWVFPEIEEIVAQEGYRGIRHELVEEHRQRMRAGAVVEAYDWDDILRDVCRRNGLSVEISVEQLVQKHAAPAKVYLLERDVLEVLRILRKNGYTLAAVTNGFYHYQKPVMDVLGLTAFFDTVITPDRSGYGKPQIEMVKSLQGAGDRIIAHVGDRIDHDVIFANELGILSVFFYRNMTGFVRKVPPEMRNKQEECLAYFRWKWRQETEEDDWKFPLTGVPDVVVYTMNELVAQLRLA
ncbi:HAD family hydrolase [Ornithinibacillus contaminans]|uniref:HAD family hydrolase n=1 Tax=Ornithinibacillus contaminans TaxID=694055 RepID=UPI00064DC425|nr:HAD family hydrolase [Ornithinibacillus contaminans]